LDIDWYAKILLLIGCLVLSAFFSGSEVALFSLDKNKVKEIKNLNPFIGGYIFNLLEYPRRLLVTILLGNTIVNVAATIVGVTLALEIAEGYNISKDLALTLQIIILTVLVLLIGEITPKVWASKHPVQFSKIICIPMYWISILIYPISKTLTDVIKALASKIRIDKSKTAILGSELVDLADLGVEKGTIVEEEHGLIHGLVQFRTITVREVMTPRVDIAAVSIDTNFDELMTVITESKHSRLPLYRENLDDIAGIVYTKDILPYVKDDTKRAGLKLEAIARKAIFVPETKLISDLMKEFQEKKMHMGIVVDEYGGTAGLISLEDILEEIVGEIRDEYDIEETEISKIDDNSYIILGKTSIDEVNDLLDTNLSTENDDYDTIGGFVMSQAGNIPSAGYNFIFDKFKFTVKEVVNRRVTKIQVEHISSVNHTE